MIMAFDGGPLIIDQTPADPSGLTDKDSVRSFWLRVLPETTYRDEDRSLPTTMTVFDFNAHPLTVVLASGNFSETERIHELLQDYCLAGGAVLFEGRDLFNTDDLTAGQRYFGTGDFAYDYFGIREAYYPATMLSHPTQMNAEFIGASSMNSDFPDLIVDSTRTDWGIPKQLQPAGAAIPFVGWITGDSRSTSCIYTYESLFPDASASQGHCVGLLYDNGRRRAGIFNFPLSMMAEEKAASALRTMLAYLSSSPAFKPGDFDGDGFVGVLDAVKMVTWVFRGGPAPVDFNSADVNADCRINLLDIVVLVNYVFRGGPPPQPGCIQGSVGPFFDPPVIVGTKKPGDQATRSRLPVDYKSILLP